MRGHNERLYRAARAITRDDREAEDVMQQAYVNAFANLRQFKGGAQFATWLTRIAINEALARVRRRGHYEPFNDELANVEAFMPSRIATNPEREAFTGELRELREWAIDALPDGAREVFVLRVEGLSTAERAASLGVSEDTGQDAAVQGPRRASALADRARPCDHAGRIPVLSAWLRSAGRRRRRPHRGDGAVTAATLASR